MKNRKIRPKTRKNHNFEAKINQKLQFFVEFSIKLRKNGAQIDNRIEFGKDENMVI